MKIAIVGVGRLGSALASLLGARHELHPVRRGVPIPDNMDVVWLAVPDSAVCEVGSGVVAGPVVLHSAGVLENASLRPASPVARLHPLFPIPFGTPPDFRGAYARIDGDEPAVRVAFTLAAELGLVALNVPGDPRLYHAAAVLAGNHIPAFFLQAARVLQAAGVDEALARRALLPLVAAALANVSDAGASALTGPATRNDVATETAHRDGLVAAHLKELLAAYDIGAATARSLLLDLEVLENCAEDKARNRLSLD